MITDCELEFRSSLIHALKALPDRHTVHGLPWNFDYLVLSGTELLIAKFQRKIPQIFFSAISQHLDCFLIAFQVLFLFNVSANNV